MYCRKCGKQLPDGTKFCTYCGAPQVVDAQQVSTATPSESAPASSPTPNIKQTTPSVPKQPMDPAKKKKMTITICAIAGGVLAIIIALVIINNMPTKIDLSQCMTATYEGYDGYGKVDADLSFDETKFGQKYENLQEEFFKNGSNIVTYGNYANLENSFYCKWDYAGKENGTLANGDEITYSCTYDEDLAKKLKYEFVNTEKTFTVEGLEEAKVLDLFADVTVQWNFDNGYPSLDVENNTTDSYIKDLYMYDSPVDDAGNVTITFNTSADSLAYYGYAAKDNVFEKTFNVGIKPIQITDINADDTKAAVKTAADTAIDNLINSCGWSVYKGGNPIDVYDYTFVESRTSWSNLQAEYEVNTSDGTYKKTITVKLYRLGDGTIYDATKALNGCEVSSGTWSGNVWY